VHCALYPPDRGVILAGDALVMLDPYTARRGPCLVARAATADTGHGPPWTEGIETAVQRARAAGAA
jgi:hypothetical protein